jgi:hypothetical protein
MAYRTKTTEYRGWRIKSSPTSHRGERMYEVGIFGPAGLADVAFESTRSAAIASAVRLIDLHLSGERTLHNLMPGRATIHVLW